MRAQEHDDALPDLSDPPRKKDAAAKTRGERGLPGVEKGAHRGGIVRLGQARPPSALRGSGASDASGASESLTSASDASIREAEVSGREAEVSGRGSETSGRGSETSGREVEKSGREAKMSAGAASGRETKLVVGGAVPRAVSGGEAALDRGWRGGFVFFCRYDSFRETHERKVFGLAPHKQDLVATVEPGTTALFLFDQTYRYLHGVYEATAEPGIDLDPDYLKGAVKATTAGSPFPVQVRFALVHKFKPLPEVRPRLTAPFLIAPATERPLACSRAQHKFCHLVGYNKGTNVFRHRLSEQAAGGLLRLLAHPEEAPTDNQLPWESNGYRKIPETARFRDQRRAAYGEDE